jgi:hypothetical protein
MLRTEKHKYRKRVIAVTNLGIVPETTKKSKAIVRIATQSYSSQKNQKTILTLSVVLPIHNKMLRIK